MVIGGKRVVARLLLWHSRVSRCSGPLLCLLASILTICVPRGVMLMSPSLRFLLEILMGLTGLLGTLSELVSVT